MAISELSCQHCLKLCPQVENSPKLIIDPWKTYTHWGIAGDQQSALLAKPVLMLGRQKTPMVQAVF